MSEQEWLKVEWTMWELGVGIVNSQKVMSDDAWSDDASKIALLQ
jgi:hypothetical protein